VGFSAPQAEARGDQGARFVELKELLKQKRGEKNKESDLPCLLQIDENLASPQALLWSNLDFCLQPTNFPGTSPFLFVLCFESFFPPSSSAVLAISVALAVLFGRGSCVFSSSFSYSALSVGHGGVFRPPLSLPLSFSLSPSCCRAAGGLGWEWAASFFFCFTLILLSLLGHGCWPW